MLAGGSPWDVCLQRIASISDCSSRSDREGLRGVGDVNQTKWGMHESSDADALAGIGCEFQEIRFGGEAVREAEVDVVEHAKVVIALLSG